MQCAEGRKPLAVGVLVHGASGSRPANSLGLVRVARPARPALYVGLSFGGRLLVLGLGDEVVSTVARRGRKAADNRSVLRRAQRHGHRHRLGAPTCRRGMGRACKGVSAGFGGHGSVSAILDNRGFARQRHGSGRRQQCGAPRWRRSMRPASNRGRAGLVSFGFGLAIPFNLGDGASLSSRDAAFSGFNWRR